MWEMDVVDGAITDPSSLAAALRPTLTRHPVPQSDPRTRGLLLETSWRAADRANLRATTPALVSIFERFATASDAGYLLAVNETPPGQPDDFLMRPHIDRLWRAGGFAGGPPRRTTVVFLHFPPTGTGGELVVFGPDAFANRADVAVPRSRARDTVAKHGGVLVKPQPGRACTMAGHLPHAVLGYSAPAHEAWRLAVVMAEFAPP
jgi:hypothetical protein